MGTIWKCVIWGSGEDYHECANQIQYEICKSNLSVEAIVTKNIIGKSLDGFPLVSSKKLTDIKFDYLLVLSSKYFKEIHLEAIQMGIAEDVIINGRVLKIPFFDFNRYVNLLRNPITIFSDDCWGGCVCHFLYLKFNTPFINLAVPNESYIRFLQNPSYYLESPLIMEREGNPYEDVCPVGVLGEGDSTVRIIFSHMATFAEAKKTWDRRRENVNFNNIFVKMAITSKNDELLMMFDELSYSKKTVFCTYPTKSETAVYVPRFVWNYHANCISQGTQNSYRLFLMNMEHFSKAIDILKLLNGEADFSREI